METKRKQITIELTQEDLITIGNGTPLHINREGIRITIKIPIEAYEPKQ